MSLTDQIQSEWDALEELLPRAREAWGDRVTLGEVIHKAAQVGIVCTPKEAKADDPWDAWPGTIAAGLRRMLADPDAVIWRITRNDDAVPDWPNAMYELEAADEGAGATRLLTEGWEPFAIHRERRVSWEHDEFRCRDAEKVEMVTVYHFRRKVTP